jgi:hypothetical protein
MGFSSCFPQGPAGLGFVIDYSLQMTNVPSFEKGGEGGFNITPEIPLNPPFSKGDLGSPSPEPKSGPDNQLYAVKKYVETQESYLGHQINQIPNRPLITGNFSMGLRWRDI